MADSSVRLNFLVCQKLWTKFGRTEFSLCLTLTSRLELFSKVVASWEKCQTSIELIVYPLIIYCNIFPFWAHYDVINYDIYMQNCRIKSCRKKLGASLGNTCIAKKIPKIEFKGWEGINRKGDKNNCNSTNYTTTLKSE